MDAFVAHVVQSWCTGATTAIHLATLGVLSSRPNTKPLPACIGSVRPTMDYRASTCNCLAPLPRRALSMVMTDVALCVPNDQDTCSRCYRVSNDRIANDWFATQSLSLLEVFALLPSATHTSGPWRCRMMSPAYVGRHVNMELLNVCQLRAPNAVGTSHHTHSLFHYAFTFSGSWTPPLGVCLELPARAYSVAFVCICTRQ